VRVFLAVESGDEPRMLYENFFDMPQNPPLFAILMHLPVAISFYGSSLFSMSETVYKTHAEARRHGDFSLSTSPREP
jgi:hypothetical protein